MRIRTVFTALWILTIFLAAEPANIKNTVNLSSGIYFSYNSIPIEAGSADRLNHWRFLYSALRCKLDVSDFLSLGLLAGYQTSSLKDTIDFTALPLSLRMNRTSYPGFLVGAFVHSTPYSGGDFSFVVQGDILFALPVSKTWPLTLPIEAGNATVRESFFLVTGDIWAQYDGFSGFTPFAGARVHLFRGKLKATETLADLEGIEEIKISQHKMFGPLAGVIFEVGSNWEIAIKASLISRLAADLDIRYIW